MKHIEGVNRDQRVLFPDTLDDYVSEDNPVRLVDIFVEQLDLASCGFQRVEPASTGRPPYHPEDLLKLFLYGYLNRIRSGRRLEQECQRNVEVMWLLKRLAPDFKTLCDFRRLHAHALKAAFRALVQTCGRLQCIDGQLLGLDGSVFRAVNSKARIVSRAKLEAQRDQLDREIDAYLEELERNDTEEEQRIKDRLPLNKDEIQNLIKQLKKRKIKLGQHLKQIPEGKAHQCTTDRDAQLIQRRGKNACVGYNTQLVSDAQYKLCVSYAVTSTTTDIAQLTPMTHEAMETLALQRTTILADTGYYNGQQLEQAEARGATVYLPEVNTSKNKACGRYDKTVFHYDAQQDRYICPQGEFMTPAPPRPYGESYRTTYRTPACRRCAARAQCTKDRKGRAIHRMAYEAALEALRDRNQRAPEMMRKRKALIEHPFGTLKHNWGYSHFLVKGKDQVNGEMALMLMAYNLKRLSTIFGAKVVQRIQSG
jgi:transposase